MDLLITLQPQIELFYRNSDQTLIGRSLNNLKTNPSDDDSIRDKEIKTHRDSAIASYWPWIIYQGDDEQLYAVTNKQHPGPSTSWVSSELGVYGTDGTSLAIVPTSANFSDIITKGGFAAFLRGGDGKLTAYLNETADSKSPGKTGELTFST